MRWLVVAGCTALVGATGCLFEDDAEAPMNAGRSASPAADPPPAVGPATSVASSPPPASAVPPERPVAATVLHIRVPGDLPAAVVRGPAGTTPSIVFLPGVCSNASAYLHSFPQAARAHGGVVAIDGELPCEGSPGFRTFARNIPAQHARIEAALAAAGASAVPAQGLTLVGYSLGASIVEDLARKYPERYTRVVLIGSPADPSVDKLRAARAVATISCELDVPPRMRGAAKRLREADVPAAYFEMPGCTHGLIAEGERVLGEVFEWLDAHQRPPIGAPRAAVPITGVLDATL